MIPYSTPGPKSVSQSHSHMFDRKSKDSKPNTDSKSFINLYNKPKDFPSVYSNINNTPKLDTASDLQNMWVSEDFQGTPLKKYEDFRRRVEFCSDLDSIPESLYPSEPDAEIKHLSDNATPCKPTVKAISSINKIWMSNIHSEEASTLYQPELSTKAMRNPCITSYQPDVTNQAGRNTYAVSYQPEVSTQVAKDIYAAPYQPEVSTQVVRDTYTAPYQTDCTIQTAKNSYTPVSVNEAPTKHLAESTPMKNSIRANDSLFIQTFDSIKKEQEHDHIVPTLGIEENPPIAGLGEVFDNESPATYWDRKESVLLNEFDVKLPDSETEADLPCDAELVQSSINQQNGHTDAVTSTDSVHVTKESGQIQELLEELNQLGDQSGSIAYDPCSGQSLMSKDEQDPDKKTSVGHDEPPDSYDTYSHSVPLFSQCSEEMLAQVPQTEADTNLDSLTDAQVKVVGTEEETQLLSQCSTTHLDMVNLNADRLQSNENSSNNTCDQLVDVITDTGQGFRCESLLVSSETQTEIKVFVDSATSPIIIELLRTQLIPEATMNNVQSNLVLNVKPIDATCYNYGEFRTAPEMPAQFLSEHVGTLLSCKQEAARPCHVDSHLENHGHVNDQHMVTTNLEETICVPGTKQTRTAAVDRAG